MGSQIRLQDDHEMASHYHPKCFPYPKKTIKAGISDDDLVSWLSEGRCFEALTDDQIATVVAGIREGIAYVGPCFCFSCFMADSFSLTFLSFSLLLFFSFSFSGSFLWFLLCRPFDVHFLSFPSPYPFLSSPPFRRSDPKAIALAQKRKYAEMKAEFDANEECDDGSPSSKKSKKMSPEMKEMGVFLKYNAMKGRELKELLAWNRQTKSGTKDILVEKCKDGEMNGAIPPCPACSDKSNLSSTSLRLDPNTGGFICGGFFDKESDYRRNCPFKSAANELKRDPWVLCAEDSREVVKDPNANASSGKSLISDAAFGIPPGSTMRQAVLMLYSQAQKEGIALPEDNSTKQKIGANYMCHDSRKDDGSADGRALLVELASSYGTVTANKEAKDARAAACGNPKNAGMLECFTEILHLQKQAGVKGFKLGSLHTIISFLGQTEEEVTEGKKYSKGKGKIKGVGASTADKINQYVATGTMVKLEKLREEAGLSVKGEEDSKASSSTSSSSSSSSSNDYGSTSY